MRQKVLYSDNIYQNIECHRHSKTTDYSYYRLGLEISSIFSEPEIYRSGVH